MKIYHQAGHNLTWNIDSLNNDLAGNGLIFSPINTTYKNLKKIAPSILENSFFDPQIYFINDNKGKLNSYPYYPKNFKNDIETDDLEDNCNLIAEKCISIQSELNFEYIVIPTRYYESISPKNFNNQLKYFTIPFVEFCKMNDINKKILQTIIVKKEQLTDKEKTVDLLNFLTSLNDVSGFYLIFEHNSASKQLKEIGQLFAALKIINILKINDFEVHIGYCNTEGIIYSILKPDSISMGAYENLRLFNINRFITPEEKTRLGPPNVRLYSAQLYQFIDNGYISAMKILTPDLVDTVFPESKYKHSMFDNSYKWHFTKKDAYMHYFIEYSKQLEELSNKNITFLKKEIQHAMKIFDKIQQKGIALDGNSDGSHLSYWLTLLNMWEKTDKDSI